MKELCFKRNRSSKKRLYWIIEIDRGSRWISFIPRIRRLSIKLHKLGHIIKLMKSFFRNILWSIRGSYQTIWSVPPANVKWHSDTRPAAVTSQNITQILWTWCRTYPLRNCKRFPWCICAGCCMPEGALILPDTWFRRFLGTCICSNCCDYSDRQSFRILHWLKWPSTTPGITLCKRLHCVLLLNVCTVSTIALVLQVGILNLESDLQYQLTNN